MNHDERLAQRVGAITLIVLTAIVAGFVFLLDRIELGAPIRIRVAFHHIAGLHEHAPLVVAGEPVGRIDSISPVAHGSDPVLDGEVGVAATVAIARGQAWKVPAGAAIFVASRGPLSDKYLEVAPPHGEPGPAVHDGQELRGVDPPELDNVLQHTWVNITTAQLFIATVKPEWQALRTQLTTLLDQLAALDADLPAGGARTLVDTTRGALHEAEQTYARGLGGDPGVAALRAMLVDARSVITQLRRTLDRVQPRLDELAAGVDRVRDHVAQAAPVERAQQTVDAVRAALAKLDPMLASLDQLAAQLAIGEGTIGRILNDPEFPEEMRDLSKQMKRQPWKVLETPPPNQ